MNINMDMVFKVMSAGLIPAMLWVNSQSVDIALLKRELESHKTRLDKVEAQQTKILQGVTDNQIALKSMTVTMNFMKDFLTYIKNAR